MIKIEQAVIVEGKYDKIKLSSFIDALIITTDGFGVFNDDEKQKFIKRLADEKGILIITDSDAAGFKIRSFIGGMVSPDRIFHAYIPDVYGKESRKEAASSEGKLGVEGMSAEIIRKAVALSGIEAAESSAETRTVTSSDLYEYGIIGKTDSAARRRGLLVKLGLPERLSSASLLKILNGYISFDDFISAVQSLD